MSAWSYLISHCALAAPDTDHCLLTSVFSPSWHVVTRASRHLMPHQTDGADYRIRVVRNKCNIPKWWDNSDRGRRQPPMTEEKCLPEEATSEGWSPAAAGEECLKYEVWWSLSLCNGHTRNTRITEYYYWVSPVFYICTMYVGSSGGGQGQLI